MNYDKLKEENIDNFNELNKNLATLDEFREYSEKLKALSDPTRLKILFLLQANEYSCTCALQNALDKPQSNISHHLKILKNAGFIKSQKEGTWVLNKLVDPEIPELLKTLIDIIK